MASNGRGDYTQLNFVTDYGADPTGVKDATTAVEVALGFGGRLYIPAGDYLIGRPAVVLVKAPLIVECSPRARLFCNDLDGDMIRLTPATAHIDVHWYGGTIDQRGQCGSTSMPFLSQYPPPKQGLSPTCDGISFRKNAAGFRSVTISGVSFVGGTHWEAAGGDSGLYAEGFELLSATGNFFYGNRDQGVYVSGNCGRTVIDRNIFKNCFGGASAKRSVSGASVVNNSFQNCVLGVFLAHVEGTGVMHSDVSGNYFEQAQIEVRADYATNVSIARNHGANFGAMRADGTTPVVAYTPAAVQLNGCTHCHVEGNGSVLSSAVYAGTSYLTVKGYTLGGVLVKSAYNRVVNNTPVGFLAGGETPGEAEWNTLS